MTSEEVKPIVDDLLAMRGTIYDLIADAKVNKANAKYFAYKKCYNMLSAIIYPLTKPEEQSKL